MNQSNNLKEIISEIIEHYEHLPYRGSKFFPQNKIADYFVKNVFSSIDKGASVFLGEDANAFFIFEKLDWDSAHFGVLMGKISYFAYKKDIYKNQLKKIINDIISLASSQSIKHISIFTQLKETLLIEVLEEEGFHLKGMMVDYMGESEKISQNSKSSPALIKKADEKDVQALADISFESFSDKNAWLDRFHADSFFPKEKSDLLYKNWLINSFYGNQADCVLAAYIDEKPVGFITLKIEREKSDFFGNKYGKVPLNAVCKTQRRKGIYKDLVISGCEWFKENGIEFVSVRTQASTIAVQKTWQKLGAELMSYNLVFHKTV